MKILVVGSGGREHALTWALSKSASVEKIYAAPGNPGIANLATCVDLAVTDIDQLADFASSNSIDLTVVGPEIPLVAGLADTFASRGLRVFGPSAAAAQIEGSKVFCRDLAARHGVATAAGGSFSDPDEASDFARSIKGAVVVKADGLAAGKGVKICADSGEAVTAIDEIMREGLFGDSGSSVIVEEFISGREISIFCLTSGGSTIVLDPAQDYKRASDGDLGDNTGGMGSYSPVPWLSTDIRDRAVAEVVQPLIDGMAAEGVPYSGCFYAGLMICDDGPKLIEVNCRFGDPETQVVLPRIDSDFAELLMATAEQRLDEVKVSWKQQAAVTVVIASGGYPGSYETGVPITGVQDAEAMDDVTVFHAGTALDASGHLVSAGGRVLNVTALGSDIADARERAYKAAAMISMDGSHMRTDIAAGIN